MVMGLFHSHFMPGMVSVVAPPHPSTHPFPSHGSQDITMGEGSAQNPAGVGAGAGPSSWWGIEAAATWLDLI